MWTIHLRSYYLMSKMSVNKVPCIFQCLIVLFAGVTTEGDDGRRYKVIIVGAGAAGLSAAGKLSENNITDLIILEARNRTGGRILTTKFGEYKIDLGPHYVHGQNDNIVYSIMKNVSLLEDLEKSSGFSDIIVSPESIQFDKNLYHDISEYVTNDTKGLTESHGPYSNYIIPRIKAYLTERNFSKSESEILIDAVRKVESAFRGAELEEIGTQGLSDYMESSDSIEMYWKKGYETFIKVLTGNHQKEKSSYDISEKILLNKEVNKVSWGDNGVSLNCSDGSYYFGDLVIITLPLGVLKYSPRDFFSPRLPVKKQLAVESLGFGILEYINLMFPSQWWPDDIAGVDFGLSKRVKKEYRGSAHYGTWPIAIPGFYTVPNAPLVLQGLVYGQAAKDMELSSNEDVMSGCYHILQWLFRSDNFTVPKPTKMMRSNWYGDPYSKGSFSFRSVESDKKNIKGLDLAKPLFNSKKEPVVLFAGEATDSHYFSTVDGAVKSGWREAARILKYLNKKSQ